MSTQHMPGTPLRVVANYSGHNFPIGTVVRVIQFTMGSYYVTTRTDVMIPSPPARVPFVQLQDGVTDWLHEGEVDPLPGYEVGDFVTISPSPIPGDTRHTLYGEVVQVYPVVGSDPVLIVTALRNNIESPWETFAVTPNRVRPADIYYVDSPEGLRCLPVGAELRDKEGDIFVKEGPNFYYAPRGGYNFDVTNMLNYGPHILVNPEILGTPDAESADEPDDDGFTCVLDAEGLAALNPGSLVRLLPWAGLRESGRVAVEAMEQYRLRFLTQDGWVRAVSAEVAGQDVMDRLADSVGFEVLHLA